jgi:hypothetical protein
VNQLQTAVREFGEKIAEISAHQVKTGRERFELSKPNVIPTAFAKI